MCFLHYLMPFLHHLMSFHHFQLTSRLCLIVFLYCIMPFRQYLISFLHRLMDFLYCLTHFPHYLMNFLYHLFPFIKLLFLSFTTVSLKFNKLTWKYSIQNNFFPISLLTSRKNKKRAPRTLDTPFLLENRIITIVIFSFCLRKMTFCF